MRISGRPWWASQFKANKSQSYTVSLLSLCPGTTGPTETWGLQCVLHLFVVWLGLTAIVIRIELLTKIWLRIPVAAMMLSGSKGSEEEEEDVGEVEGAIEWEVEGVAKGGRRSCQGYFLQCTSLDADGAWIASQLGCPPFTTIQAATEVGADLRYATRSHRTPGRTSIPW
jgi:hypothetical protein